MHVISKKTKQQKTEHLLQKPISIYDLCMDGSDTRTQRLFIILSLTYLTFIIFTISYLHFSCSNFKMLHKDYINVRNFIKRGSIYTYVSYTYDTHTHTYIYISTHTHTRASLKEKAAQDGPTLNFIYYPNDHFTVLPL